MTGAGPSLSPVSLRCAVLSGGMTAFQLAPGTGVCKPNMASWRGASGRWRQVTKLPRPFPQHPPFDLRYGFLRCIPRLRRYQRRTAARVSLVPLMSSF